MKPKPLLIALCLAVATVRAGSVKIELPPETPVFKSAPGSELVAAQCLTCHSAEYIATQPPLPRAYWQSAVTKMQQKFGAPIPPEQVSALADYLAKNYGGEKSAGPAK